MCKAEKKTFLVDQQTLRDERFTCILYVGLLSFRIRIEVVVSKANETCGCVVLCTVYARIVYISIWLLVMSMRQSRDGVNKKQQQASVGVSKI